MKLKVKVFLVTMVLVVFSISITAIAIVQINFNTLLQREREQAVIRQDYLIGSITNQIAVQKISYHQISMEQADLQKMISDLSTSQFDMYHLKVLMKQGDQYIVGENHTILDQQSDLLQRLEDSRSIFTDICEDDGRTYLLAICNLTLENEVYVLATISDISDLFSQYSHQVILVLIISLVLASLLAIILYFSLNYLLNPLTKLNQLILRIANGDYDLRLEEKGSVEFEELADNVNMMSEAIRSKTEMLEELADNRQQFINHFAHEMKTPLTSILGFADILRLKKDVAESERQEYASIIAEEATRLKVLSSKLLELVTTNDQMLEMRPVSLKALFTDIWQSMQPLLARKKVSLIIKPSDLILICDKYLISSMLYNLIDNAYKASFENGMIYLKAYQVDQHTVLEVKDNGRGMSEKTIRHALEPFYMEDKARSRKNGGSGLGLALCAKIADAHHAKLYIESQLGKGTSIYIEFRKEQGDEV